MICDVRNQLNDKGIGSIRSVRVFSGPPEQIAYVVVLGSIPCDNVKVNRKAKALKFSASHQVNELADVT